MGVRLHGFESLAEEIAWGAGALGERLQMPLGGDLLLLQEVLREGRFGYFAPVQEDPGFAAALLATIRDLKDAGIGHAALRETGHGIGARGKLEGLAAVYEAYEEALREKDLADGSDLVLAAAEAVEQGRGSFESDLRFLVYGVYDFTGLQRRLLEALLRRAPSAAVFFPPESSFSKPALEFFRNLGASESRLEQGANPSAVRRISAGGRAEEVRELVREIRALAEEGFQLEEIGVVARNAASYDALVRESLEAAGIPLSPARGRSLSRTDAGRAFLLALSLDPERPARRDLLTLLQLPAADAAGLAGVPDPPFPLWDRWLREASVTRFGKAWEDGFLGGVPEGSRAEAERAAAALRRALSLLRGLPDEPSPKEAAEALVRLGGALLRPSPSRDLLIHGMRGLCALGAVRERLGAEEVREVVGRVLESEEEPAEEGGVFWGDPLAARGLSFRALFLLGMAEKEFPRHPRPDPVLLDPEREELSRRLPGTYLQPKSRGRQEEDYLFRLLREGAGERLFLLRPRLDPVSGKRILPSPFLSDVGAAEEAAPLKFWAAGARGEASGLAEFDLRAIDALAGKDAHLARAYVRRFYGEALSAGLRLEEERWSFGRLTAYDGALGPEAAGKIPALVFRDGVSPTKLEALARCPFRFFLEAGLQLAPLEEPEEESELDPRAKGILIHKTLAAFFRGLPKGKPLAQIPSAERRGRLERVFATCWKDREREGIPGGWADREEMRFRLLGQLQAYLDAQAEEGMPVPAEVEWPIPEGTEFDTGKRRFLLRGRVDRIDLEGDLVRVVDVKSGKRPTGIESLQGGQRLQVSLYAHAVKKAFGAREVAGEYHYLQENNEARPAALGEHPEVQRAVETLLGLAEGGIFLQLPQKSEKGTCISCEVREACAGEQEIVFERKRGDPRSAGFLGLRLPPKGGKPKKPAAGKGRKP